MQINVVGNIFGITGYDIHTRCLANALFNIGCDVRLECQKPDQWPRYCNDNEMKMIEASYNPDNVTVAICQPHAWPVFMSRKPKKFFGFCVWEGDKIPKFWKKYLEDKRVDNILVPSEHTKKAILKVCKGLSKKIVIVPHGVNSKVFHPIKKKKNDHFIFVANKGWNQGLNDRGGIQFIIKAFNDEFSKDEKVKLHIKINSSYLQNPLEKLKVMVDEIEKTWGLNKSKNPPAFVIDNLDESALNKFYNEGDVFISCSMAEAFNIPCLEAMACGLPVITTSFGGQSDYVNDKNGFLINNGFLDYFSNELIYEDTRWFKPEINTIRSLMRYCYNNRKIVQQKGKKALSVAQSMAWEKSAKKIKDLI